jgi:hypothetical protein
MMISIFFRLFLLSIAFFSHQEIQAANGKSFCLYLQFETKIGSGLSAKPPTDGMKFAKVNGKEIPFFMVGIPVLTSSGVTLASTHEGCFEKGDLIAGSNTFSFSQMWPDTGQISPGWGKSTVSLQVGNVLVPLCFVEIVQGSLARSTCSTDMNLSLNEIDPELASKFQSLSRENPRLRINLEALNLRVADLEKLYQHLKDKFGDPDSIVEDDFVDISPEVAAQILDFIKGQKQKIADANQNAKNATESSKQKAKEVSEYLKRALEETGLNSDVVDVPFPSF